MGQVVKLQAAHAVEAEAMLGVWSAEASRQRERLLVKARERLLVKARDAWKAARTAARARLLVKARDASQGHRGGQREP